MSYNSLGGTGPKAVNDMLAEFREELATHKNVLDQDNKRVNGALEFTRTVAGKAANISSAEELKNLTRN